jgi:putative glutamine amidotransferase
MLLPEQYAVSVAAAGAIPVLLPPLAGIDEVIGRLDGLILSGGGDIDPARYGAAPDPASGRPNAARDEAELALFAAALDQRLPVLGICRGMQVMNTGLGGTLHQHLPDLVGHGRHDGPTHGFGRHGVRISPDSTLATILPEDGFIEVPTHHHQAVNLLGDGLKAVAWEEDGTVEAVEAGPSELGGFSGFVLGVQWHPEQGSDLRLFSTLVEAAAERMAAERATTEGTVLAPMI